MVSVVGKILNWPIYGNVTRAAQRGAAHGCFISDMSMVDS